MAAVVEIALITTIAVIQSGSYSFVSTIQSTTTGTTVLFSIVTFVCVCVCVCVLFIPIHTVDVILLLLSSRTFDIVHIMQSKK